MNATRARGRRGTVAAVVVMAAVLLLLAGPATAQPIPPPPSGVAEPRERPQAPTGIDFPPPVIGEPPASPDDGSVIEEAPGAEEPGLFDIGGRIQQGINDWFRDLVTSALTPALELLGQTVLATPQVTSPGRVAELWGVSAGLANAFFVLFILVGGAIVMGHETVQTRYSAKDIAPRLVIGIVAANTSLALAGMGISLANALSQGLLGQDVDPEQATLRMRQLALGAIGDGGVFLVLVGLVVAVLAVVLLAVYVIRVALVVLLVAAAPLALACHALPHTDGFARLWWRALIACLGVQVAQSLVLITALRVFFASDGRTTLGLSVGGSLVDLLVVVCLLWVLLRIPTWAGRMVFTGRGGGSTVVRTVKYVASSKVAKAVLA